jgi:dTDP-4-dehydrorhamnose reductase
VLESSPQHLVVRSSWIFGPGRNFVRAVLAQAEKRRSGEQGGPLRVVDDQRGSPTSAQDLAEGICALVERGARGLLHLANAGEASWWDLARTALDGAGYADLGIERIATAELGLPAERPRYSVLDVSRAARLGVALRPWREALAAYLASPDLRA